MPIMQYLLPQLGVFPLPVLVSDCVDCVHMTSSVVLTSSKLFTQETTCKALFNWASNGQS